MGGPVKNGVEINLSGSRGQNLKPPGGRKKLTGLVFQPTLRVSINGILYKHETRLL